MARVRWVGAGRRDQDNSQAMPTRLINCYREILAGRPMIKAVAGQVAFASLAGVPFRALARVNQQIFAAHAGALWRVDSNGAAFSLGEILDAEDTTIAGNNGKVTLTSGGRYHVYTGTGMVIPSLPVFTQVGSVEFWGQRTVLTERGGRRVAWSALADAETFGALDFATAENDDDAIIRGIVIGGLYWIFKQRSIERWYLTGAADFAKPVGGGALGRGLKALSLITKIPNGAFFVGDDNVTYVADQSGVQPVSIRGVETALAQDNPAACFFTEDEGGKFCHIAFPGREAWVLNLSTMEWHERADGAQGAWAARAAVNCYDRSFVADTLGNIWELTRVNTDKGGALIRTMISDNLNVNDDYFAVDLFALGMNTGQADLGREAQVALSMSRDRGKTFGAEKWRGLGQLGEYGKVVRWKSLGSYRNAVARLVISEPAEITVDAEAEVVVS